MEVRFSVSLLGVPTDPREHPLDATGASAKKTRASPRFSRVVISVTKIVKSTAMRTAAGAENSSIINRLDIRFRNHRSWFFFWLLAPSVCYHLFSTGCKEDNVAILEGRFASILHHLPEEELSWVLV